MAVGSPRLTTPLVDLAKKESKKHEKQWKVKPILFG